MSKKMWHIFGLSHTTFHSKLFQLWEKSILYQHFFNLLPLGLLQIFVNFFSLVIALWIFPQFFIVNLSICDSLKWHAVERVGYFVDWQNLHNQFNFTVDLKVALKWSLNLILQLATTTDFYIRSWPRMFCN